MSGEPARAVAAVRARPYTAAAGLLAVAAAGLVLLLAHELFPYHSANHDEGVYLQQAAMLLDGRLFLTPGSDVLREAFHPWFFVEGARGLYPKYAPVPAAVFAIGVLAGDARLALAGVAALAVGLTYVLAAAAFDRRTGLLAAVILAAAPLFLVTSSVFLPYAPTTALNLGFAVAYVRAARRADRRYAALAGGAIGLAFFARPYTAVLFAAPFVAHAAWRLVRAWPDRREPFVRHGLTAGVGLAFVGLALAYNAVVTGSTLVFPYQAFAPLDGVGFGRRALLGYEVVYTPELALRANARVLAAFLTDWFTAGLLGATAAAVGVAAAIAGVGRHGLDTDAPLARRQLQVVLLGVVATVVAGNVAFWGNLNLLGNPAVAGDGFIDTFGPFYHFDLLAPLAAFAAHGVVRVGDQFRDLAAARWSPRGVRLAAVVLLVVALPLVGAAEAGALGPPLERNGVYTARYEQAYGPFRTTDLSNALVFVPPTFGEWRNHPFQWLRNDPGFDGPVVYALARGPAADFAVVDAYPDRAYYRYRYHGSWTAQPTGPIRPVLERMRVLESRALTARTTVAVPDRIIGLTAAVRVGDRVRRYDYMGTIPDRLAVDWTLAPDGVTVEHPHLTPVDGREPVAIDRPTEVVLTVTIAEPGGATLTYREAVLVRPTGNGLQVLWPPASSVCPLVTDCGTAGTYLPDRPATRPAGVAMNTTLLEVAT